MNREPSAFVLMFPEFNKRFPDEMSVVDYLFEKGWNQNKPCSSCGNTDLKATDSFRTRKCSSCGSENWIFAGTFLERIRRIRAWFAGLWFLQMGIRFSCSEFAEYLEVTSDTAERIAKTIALNLLELMEILPTVPSSEFTEIFARRSTETPARQHPRAEQTTMEESNAAQKNTDKEDASAKPECDELEDVALSDMEKSLLNQLMTVELSTLDELVDATMLDFSDLLFLLTSLEMKGIIQSLAGHQFRLSKKNKNSSSINLPESSKKVVIDFIENIKRIAQTISRKYLQLHLALYWSTIQKDIWEKHDLIFKILDKESASRQELRNYVSPINVRIPLDTIVA